MTIKEQETLGGSMAPDGTSWRLVGCVVVVVVVMLLLPIRLY